MELNEFIKNFADAIDGVDLASLSPNTNYKNDIEEWDSLAVMTVLAMIDSEYKIVISGEDVENCNTISELFELVKNRQ